MKIGIITYYDGLNAGGYLKAFATYNYLKNLGHDAYFVRPPKSLFWSDVKKLVFRKNIKRSLQAISKAKNFKVDINTMNQSELQQDTDILIFGADIIWKLKARSAEDVDFYTGGFSELPKISYAASMGYPETEINLANIFATNVNKFGSVGVRDAFTQSQVKSILQNDSNIPIVADPTLLVGRSFWLGLVRKSENQGLKIYSYIEEIDDYISALVSTHKMTEMVSIGYPLRTNLDIRSLDTVGPINWLVEMNNAEKVLTSTFHGVLFALIYNRNFYYIWNATTKDKVEDILASLDLSDRILKSPSEIFLAKEINWLEINNKLKKISDNSQKFLNEAIRDAI